jgi:FlaA1/EpsC-like NDP-sugar epimerase
MRKGVMIRRIRGLITSWDSLPRLYRGLVFVFADAAVVSVSLWLAFLIRFDGSIPERYMVMLSTMILIALAVKLPTLALFRAYRLCSIHIGLEEVFSISLACGASSLALAALLFLLHNSAMFSGLPRSILAIDFVFTMLGVVGIRLSRRMLRLLMPQKFRANDGLNALIVGAGEVGGQIVRGLKQEKNARFRPIGLVDDDKAKHGMLIHGIKVFGSISSLPRLIHTLPVEAVIIAIPSAPAHVIRDTVKLARDAGIKELKIVPFLSELYSGEARPSEIREVQSEDVLARDPVNIDTNTIQKMIEGKTVLVTGAAGSIGSELCRQVMRFGASELFALDIDETGLFNLESDIKRRFANRDFRAIIGDVRDQLLMHRLFEQLSPSVVFHAAAYKHVPLMEDFPAEAVKTNVFGTRVVLEEAKRSKTEAFVLISTDKAVNPTSVMGATKHLAELIVRSSDNFPDTRCMAVRFGNVLGSRGSVVPTFVDQIKHGGPVTVTDPEMLRYFMLTSEAVVLVLQAAAMGKGREVFVLDMGEPVSILEMAKELIRFHGYEPDKDIPIVYSGIRPGEKLFEELLTAEEGSEATQHEKIFTARMNAKLTGDELEVYLRRLSEMATRGDDGEEIKGVLQEMIFGCSSASSLQDKEE